MVFNSGFLLLAEHYDFLLRACRPRRARTKGKVERMAKYLKENFFVRYRRFDSFAHVNQQLDQWMVDVADKRKLRQFRQTLESHHLFRPLVAVVHFLLHSYRHSFCPPAGASDQYHSGDPSQRGDESGGGTG